MFGQTDVVVSGESIPDFDLAPSSGVGHSVGVSDDAVVGKY